MEIERYLSADDLGDVVPLVRKVKTVAVVGAKDKPSHPVDMVGRYLMNSGFEVIPVHPKRRDVWGLTTYSRLKDIPVPVDMVDVFRASAYCPDHVREALDLDARPLLFWIQLGIQSLEARESALQAGLAYVENRCFMVEHQNWRRKGML